MKKTLEKAKNEQEHLFNELAKLMGALGSPVRLKIFHFLTQAPHSVEQLSEKLGQSIANTSMHLKKLQRENLLKSRSEGQKRIYSLAQAKMRDFWEHILAFSLEHNPQHDFQTEYIYGENLNWTKSLDQTIQLIINKKVVVMDVRPLDEIDSEDILYKKWILNIPFSEIIKRVDEIPNKKPLLILCRGRLCIMASEVTASLRHNRNDVYRLPFSWHQLASKLAEVSP
jgi:DNA-binding transcriptional ArsR family regulator